MSTSSTSSSNIFSNAQIAAFGNRMQIFGLGSQFDTQTLLNADLNLLQMQQTPYVTQKSNYQTDQSNWTNFQKTLTGFESTINDLKNLNTDNKDVSYSEDGYVTATATGSALNGTYDVSVQQLATQQRVSSDQVASGALGISETVQLNGQNLNITSDMDINGIANSINNGSYGVGAVVLNNKLVLTSNQPGTANQMTFSGTAWDTLGVTLNGSAKNELQSAQDAQFSIDGIQMTNSSNTYTGISGVTLNLSKVTTSDVQVNVSRSADTLVSKVQAVVDNYNKVIQNINSVTAQGAALAGQNIPREVKNAMNNLLFSVTNNGTMMYQLGISIDGTAKDGTITFDSSKLTTMYNTDPQTVQNMLEGTNGFGGQLYNAVDQYAGATGAIQNTIDGIGNQIKRIDDTLQTMQDDFTRQQQSLIQKYATFETTMSSLQLQSQYIQAQLGGSSSGN